MNNDDPHGDRHKFAEMSLLLPIIAGVRELLCINALNRVDKVEWDKKEFQDFSQGLPINLHYGKPKYKLDDQTQEDFDAKRSKRRGRWNPPTFLKGRGFASTADRVLQITDLQEYTKFVREGQRRDETVEQFKQRMFSLIKSKEQHDIDAEHVRKRREDFRERMFIVKEPLEEEIDASSLEQTLET
ncbi:MAG: hypothetical protein GY820_11280, partial [Gammaproteobacteria bacterium]|nr:hypothetical protein [Gammaproteobacteria bacterium]